MYCGCLLYDISGDQGVMDTLLIERELDKKTISFHLAFASANHTCLFSDAMSKLVACGVDLFSYKPVNIDTSSCCCNSDNMFFLHGSLSACGTCLFDVRHVIGNSSWWLLLCLLYFLLLWVKFHLLDCYVAFGNLLFAYKIPSTSLVALCQVFDSLQDTEVVFHLCVQ